MFICDISVFNKYGKHKLDELLGPIGLDWRELVAILVIEQVPGITQARLIPFMQTDKGNVTKLLQGMEHKKLIKRKSDPEDGRNKLCTLAKAGQEVAPKLKEVLNQWESYCFKGLTPSEIEQFQKLSQVVLQNLIS